MKKAFLKEYFFVKEHLFSYAYFIFFLLRKNEMTIENQVDICRYRDSFVIIFLFHEK